MAQIINLRKARKAKTRAQKEQRAERNRISFGRTGQQKKLEKARVEHAEKKLDGHRLSRRTTESTGQGDQ